MRQWCLTRNENVKDQFGRIGLRRASRYRPRDQCSHAKTGDNVSIGISAATCHLFDADGLALDRVERHPLADIGR